MALVSPGMSRLTLTFAVRNDLTSYPYRNTLNHTYAASVATPNLVCFYMQTHCGQDSNLHEAFISSGPITGLCLPFHHREFFGVMTSEYGEGNYSLTHHIETHFSVIPRPERWLGLRGANVFLYGFTGFYRT